MHTPPDTHSPPDYDRTPHNVPSALVSGVDPNKDQPPEYNEANECPAQISQYRAAGTADTAMQEEYVLVFKPDGTMPASDESTISVDTCRAPGSGVPISTTPSVNGGLTAHGLIAHNKSAAAPTGLDICQWIENGNMRPKHLENWSTKSGSRSTSRCSTVPGWEHLVHPNAGDAIMFGIGVWSDVPAADGDLTMAKLEQLEKRAKKTRRGTRA